MNNKKICIYVDKFPVYSETFIIDEFKILTEMGHDVYIFARLKGTDIETLNDKLGNHLGYNHKFIFAPTTFADLSISVLKNLISNPISLIKFIYFNIFKSDNKYLSLVEKIVLRLPLLSMNFDIITAEFDTLGYHFCDLKHLLNFKVYVYVRGVAQCTNTYYKHKDLISYISLHTDKLLAMTEFLKQNSTQLGYNPNTPSKIIYPTLDNIFLQNERSCKPEHTELSIVSVGRLVWSKGYEYAINAIRLAIDRGVPLIYTIVGEGPHREAIELAIKDFGLGYSTNIRLVGKKTPYEIMNILKDADVLLQTSVIEGFGITSIEAQAMKIPVIVTNVGGLPETLIDNETGFLIESRNPYSIADCIKKCYSNIEEVKRMGINARKHVSCKFSMANYVKTLSEIYE